MSFGISLAFGFWFCSCGSARKICLVISDFICTNQKIVVTLRAGNVVWRKKENHRKQNYQHTKKWDDVMNDPANHSQEKIYESREQIELDIFENIGDTPLD